ncbi:hypothetical protein K469DRAFT_720862 [Zopfia rhizophila CBS 207.26]|uniref:Uncharacterized protein n=1 Tax=Zopfia rhizophila CBS 207.26 TaxID=1314779 RepID=A0A6A6DDJ4_9PEZI|nr:hypothetical protein K469DRAFT_720862 [Zopfia rhizophila CBS 207.26]
MGHKKLRETQTFAPVGFIGVAILSTYADARDNAMLLGDDRALRSPIRERFANLRAHPIMGFHLGVS